VTFLSFQDGSGATPVGTQTGNVWQMQSYAGRAFASGAMGSTNGNYIVDSSGSVNSVTNGSLNCNSSAALSATYALVVCYDPNNSWAQSLSLYDLSQGTWTPIDSGGQYQGSSIDESSVAYTTWDQNSQSTTVHVYNILTGTTKALTSAPNDMWNPKIQGSYVAGQGNDGNLVIINANSDSVVTTLLNDQNDGWISDFHWIGSKVYFFRFFWNGNTNDAQLFAFDTGTTQAASVHDFGAMNLYEWDVTPSGIYFTGWSNGMTLSFYAPSTDTVSSLYTASNNEFIIIHSEGP